MCRIHSDSGSLLTGINPHANGSWLMNLSRYYHGFQLGIRDWILMYLRLRSNISRILEEPWETHRGRRLSICGCTFSDRATKKARGWNDTIVSHNFWLSSLWHSSITDFIKLFLKLRRDSQEFFSSMLEAGIKIFEQVSGCVAGNQY